MFILLRRAIPESVVMSHEMEENSSLRRLVILLGVVAAVAILVPVGFASTDYTVNIQPAQTPAVPITTKPLFTTFSIASTADIVNVYYQIDNCASTGWKAIQLGINAKTWYWPGWSMSDQEWTSLGQGTHTIYFRFTRKAASTVGDAGEVSWQFFKSTQMNLMNLVQPNGGETLNRQPYNIVWTLPATSNVDTITLSYSRDGGLTYPYRIATLRGASTTYSWKSPNIRTSQARIKVMVRYTNGAEYSDTSDADFTIVKGFSFFSWVPSFEMPSFQMPSFEVPSLGQWLNKSLGVDLG
jgi:hypothetical protein